MASEIKKSNADIAWECLVAKQLILKESTRTGGAAHPLYGERMAEWRRLRDLQYHHYALAKLEEAQGKLP